MTLLPAGPWYFPVESVFPKYPLSGWYGNNFARVSRLYQQCSSAPCVFQWKLMAFLPGLSSWMLSGLQNGSQKHPLPKLLCSLTSVCGHVVPDVGKFCPPVSTLVFHVHVTFVSGAVPPDSQLYTGKVNLSQLVVIPSCVVVFGIWPSL